MKKVGLILLLLLLIGGCVTCSTRERTGATCWDGTESNATGRGACSSHGGVKNWHHSYWWDK